MTDKQRSTQKLCTIEEHKFWMKIAGKKTSLFVRVASLLPLLKQTCSYNGHKQNNERAVKLKVAIKIHQHSFERNEIGVIFASKLVFEVLSSSSSEFLPLVVCVMSRSNAM